MLTGQELLTPELGRSGCPASLRGAEGLGKQGQGAACFLHPQHPCLSPEAHHSPRLLEAFGPTKTTKPIDVHEP